eukprot:389572_1
MGLTASYPDDLDDIEQTTPKQLESISHIDKHIFLDGYIRQKICKSIHIPQCLMNLIINYFTISHCILLYSRNDDTKRGKIDFIDLNQNKYNLQRVLTLRNSVHLNHKMHLNQRSTSFAPNIIFKHHNPYKSYHAIFTAKNIVRGGSVDAILINPNHHHKIEKTYNLPFIGYGQTINHLKYSYSLKSLIAQDSFEGYINILPLDRNQPIQWKRFKDKKYKMKVYGERQYLCNCVFISDSLYGNSMNDSRIFVVNYECRGQMFNFKTEKWNKKDLYRFSKDRKRNDFGICFDLWTQRCFISGGCKDEYDYKANVNDNFVHWSSYYDFHKNRWYNLENTIHYHETNPLLWYKNHCLYILSSHIIHERELKHHWNYNDKDIDQTFEINKIGVIERYDMRCSEKRNKWVIASKDKQLSDVMNRYSMDNDINSSYIPSKLLNCLF